MDTSNSTTYCIYRIVCFPTGKCYVGQTLDFRIRKKNHFAELKNGTHHSHALQNAFNQFGLNCFYIEILEHDINEQAINEREMYWISHFDSYQNGYNQTKGGQDGSHIGDKCSWNGIEYNSLSECARANGVWVATIIRRLDLGYTCDTDMPGLAQECTWNGITYPSISAAARALGMSKNGLCDRLKKGYMCDTDMNYSHNATPCEINGILYRSVADAAKALGIKPSTLAQRRLRAKKNR